jgi:hypothetical protein
LSKAFSASTEMIMWFLSLILFTCCVRLIDSCTLNHPCIPGMKPASSWCMIFFFFLWYWTLNSGPTPQVIPQVPSQHFFLWWIFFKIGAHELFAWGWLQTSILLISAF